MYITVLNPCVATYGCMYLCDAVAESEPQNRQTMKQAHTMQQEGTIIILKL